MAVPCVSATCHFADYDDDLRFHDDVLLYCRHCLLNCGPILTERMWQISADAVNQAFQVTLYPLHQLMTPFHENSDNFYGDVGQVKVAVRLDCTAQECDRLQQLAQQVQRSQCSLSCFCSFLL